MIDWAARVKQEIAKTHPTPTDETRETPVSSVLSVPPVPVLAESEDDFVGSVSTPGPVPHERLAALMAAGALEPFDVDLFTRCWMSDPDGWSRLLDDCERTHREMTR